MLILQKYAHTMTFYYRYEDILYTEDRIMLSLRQYPLISTTKKGVWIDNFGRKRFVLNEARKKFANSTKEDALISFHARKKRQIGLLNAQLKRAEAALQLNNDNEFIYF